MGGNMKKDIKSMGMYLEKTYEEAVNTENGITERGSKPLHAAV